MPRQRRPTVRFLTESQSLTRGAGHVLEVLRRRHPDSDDLRMAVRCVHEFDAACSLAIRPVAPSAAAAAPGEVPA